MPPKGDKLTAEQVDALKKLGCRRGRLRRRAPGCPPARASTGGPCSPIGRPRRPGREGDRSGPQPDRRLHPREAGGRRPLPGPRGRSPHPHPPPDLRPDRPAALARARSTTSSHDARPDAYERLVDRLLASPRYGERWARHWLDAVRFGESHGYETNNLRPNAWPYRDWAIRAFNDDLPFARFVAEQLAGDALPDGDWLSRSATGFLVGGTHDVVGNQTPEGMKQQRVDDLDDMITATGSAFLGLTVHCARCHDHKFDPIKQADYYGLQAIFAGVEHAERAVPAPDVEAPPSRSPGRSRPSWRGSTPTSTPTHPLTGPGIEASPPPPGRSRPQRRAVPAHPRPVRPLHASGPRPTAPSRASTSWRSSRPGDAPKNLALASAARRPRASSLYPNDPHHAIEHLNDGQYGNSRSWISREPGGGWIEIELAEEAEIDRVVWGRDRLREYRDRLPTSYIDRGRHRARATGASWPTRPTATAAVGRRRRDRRRPDRRGATNCGRSSPRWPTRCRSTPARFKTPGPTRILRRGDPMQPGARGRPGGLERRRARRSSSPATRPRAPAAWPWRRWIADPPIPLPPRVAVNRAWHHHFGRGIVATPGDFGFNGDRPSHPELLDWLAREFLDNGGRSEADPPPDRHERDLSPVEPRSTPRRWPQDRDDRLLWRMSPRRLEAEAIRDAMLSASGSLDLRMGGPGYSIWEENTNYVVVFKPRDDLGPDANRRMIYQFKPRSQPDPTFGAFDCPDAALVAPRRNTSTTALQALNLLNSRFVLAQSRTLRRPPEDARRATIRRARSSLAFRLAFGREPTEAEAKRGRRRWCASTGPAALARALYNANEFVYVR